MINLLKPAKIGNVTIKNRIILPSMCLYYSDENGNVTDKLKGFIERRAKGWGRCIYCSS